jgi:hypothetical protein
MAMDITNDWKISWRRALGFNLVVLLLCGVYVVWNAPGEICVDDISNIESTGRARIAQDKVEPLNLWLNFDKEANQWCYVESLKTEGGSNMGLKQA